MKADALTQQAIADGVLYDSGFNDGVASVDPNVAVITPAQEQADIADAVVAAIQPLNDQITTLQLEKASEDALLAAVQTATAALVALLSQ